MALKNAPDLALNLYLVESVQNKSKFNLPALFVLVALFSGSAFADDGSEFYLMATPGIRLATEQHAKDENGQMLQDHHFNEGGFKPWY